MIVKSSDEWHEYVTKMVEARKQASLLKAQLEYIRMRFSEQQSHEATKRAEMKL
jgi:23S rRNA maturation mini-RNase III